MCILVPYQACEVGVNLRSDLIILSISQEVRMFAKKYIVRLSESEQATLKAVIRSNETRPKPFDAPRYG